MRNYGRVVHNPLGHTVYWPRRPQAGWGKCFFNVIPEGKQYHKRCQRERFSRISSFCYLHIEWWVEERAKIRADRILKEEAIKPDPLSEEDFLIKNPKEAVAFLSKINYYIYKGWLDPVKARIIRETVVNQTRVLREAMGGPRDPRDVDTRTPDEIEEDRKHLASLESSG